MFLHTIRNKIINVKKLLAQHFFKVIFVTFDITFQGVVCLIRSCEFVI